LIEPLLSDDAFLDDVASIRGRPNFLDIWWLGQSGFLIHRRGHLVLMDPYLSDSLTEKYKPTDKPHVRMSKRVVDPERLDGINVVTASHGHTDHLDAETLQALRRAGDFQFVAPKAIEQLATERLGRKPDVLLDDGEHITFEDIDIEILAIPSAHESIDRDAEGYCLYLGYIVRIGPWKIYHSGDTVHYKGLLLRLKQFRIDVAMLPINGRAPERRVSGNLSGREAADLATAAGIRAVIPCHYDLFEFNTASPDEFVAECQRLGQHYAVLKLGERLSLAENLT
jgi:L-ascorbate metabolism protein UlaG (beta-lactamase superfamily)